MPIEIHRTLDRVICILVLSLSLSCVTHPRIPDVRYGINIPLEDKESIPYSTGSGFPTLTIKISNPQNVPINLDGIIIHWGDYYRDYRTALTGNTPDYVFNNVPTRKLKIQLYPSSACMLPVVEMEIPTSIQFGKHAVLELSLPKCTPWPPPDPPGITRDYYFIKGVPFIYPIQKQ